jgi:hypothetical protein
MDAKRKKAYLSVIGAGIVLISFIGNEVFKENYKDKLAGLGASEALLVTRRDLFSSQEATQRTMNEKARNEVKELKATEDLIFNQYMEYDREDNVALDAIKDAVKDNDEQAAISEEEKNVQERSNRSINDLLIAHNNWVSAERRGENTLPFGQAITQAQFEINELDSSTDKLMKQTVSAIQEQRAAMRETFERWKKLGYAVFGIGWLMNLAGTLWKIDGLEIDVK